MGFAHCAEVAAKQPAEDCDANTARAPASSGDALSTDVAFEEKRSTLKHEEAENVEPEDEAAATAVVEEGEQDDYGREEEEEEDHAFWEELFDDGDGFTAEGIVQETASQERTEAAPAVATAEYSPITHEKEVNWEEHNNAAAPWQRDHPSHALQHFMRGAKEALATDPDELPIGRHSWAISLGARRRFGAIKTVLEVGCGSGEDALYLAAEHGYDVVAFDLSAGAIKKARAKAAAAGSGANVTFSVFALETFRPPHLFDLVYDRGVYHNVRQTDEELDNYKAFLGRVLKPQGHVLLIQASTWLDDDDRSKRKLENWAAFPPLVTKETLEDHLMLESPSLLPLALNLDRREFGAQLQGSNKKDWLFPAWVVLARLRTRPAAKEPTYWPDCLPDQEGNGGAFCVPDAKLLGK